MIAQHLADYGALDFRQRFNIFVKRLFFKLATNIIASTNAAKKDLVQYFHYNPGKIIVFPNMLPALNVNREQDHGFKIGYAGRLDPSKGVDVLLKAFKKVLADFPGASLDIVGDGISATNLKQLAQQLQLINVKFHGKISYGSMPSFISKMSALVVPSRTDNLPTVIIEAFAAGTPVIGSNAGGITDMIQHGYNGLLFINEDEKDLAEKIIYLFNNPQLSEKISANGKDFFNSNYNIEMLPVKFEKLLEAIM